MLDQVGDFRRSIRPYPHPARAKAILRDHPEVRQLFGHNVWSFGVILLVVVGQFCIAGFMSDKSWWLVVPAAWCIGAFCNHAMYVMIHEAGHSLIFRRRAMNELAAILADLPNVLPAAISFRTYHFQHHAHLGVHGLDADLASHWEARLIGNRPLAKAIWFLFFPFFQALRIPRLKSIRFLSSWTVLNWLIVVAFDGWVLWLWGPKALMYLALSFLFSIGFHPLGARWI